MRRVGVAADHAGHALKAELAKRLADAGYRVVDFGSARLEPGDDYPDYVVPLARAVATGEVERGIAVCGSGVGASVVANRIPGVRASLIHDVYSAHQGVEDDDMNLISLGGRVIGEALAWELVRTFLDARFGGADRHRRRLAAVGTLEARQEEKVCMKKNPCLELTTLGQSLWVDYLDRGQLASGQLQRQLREDGVRGVTSNPAIFEKAVSGDRLYDAPIDELARQGASVAGIYETITTRDVQLAADLLRPLYDRLGGHDGFVSLEVSPHLAHDTTGTIAEARRLWAAVGRPNAMIKVPATDEGLPAIQRLIAEGINVNVTLLFGLGRYAEVASAYLAGLESRAGRGDPVVVASVASFFVSRIDVLVDARVDALMRAGRLDAKLGARLRGQVGIALARVAYQAHRDIFRSGRFQALAAKGARVQRMLWASTSTKDPACSDVKYVEALIGEETIDTVTVETLDAYRDHGVPALRLEEDLEQANSVVAALEEAGIELDALTRQLEDEGVQKFIDAYDRLYAVIARRRDAVLGERAAGPQEAP